MATEVSKEAWIDWRNSAVTQEFLLRLKQKRELLKEGLAEGEASDERQARVVMGQCQAYKDTILYALEGFETIDGESDAD